MYSNKFGTNLGNLKGEPGARGPPGAAVAINNIVTGSIVSIADTSGNLTGTAGAASIGGVTLTLGAANPGGTNTLWGNSSDTTHPYFGSNKIALSSDIVAPTFPLSGGVTTTFTANDSSGKTFTTQTQYGKLGKVVIAEVYPNNFNLTTTAAAFNSPAGVFPVPDGVTIAPFVSVYWTINSTRQVSAGNINFDGSVSIAIPTALSATTTTLLTGCTFVYISNT